MTVVSNAQVVAPRFCAYKRECDFRWHIIEPAIVAGQLVPLQKTILLRGCCLYFVPDRLCGFIPRHLDFGGKPIGIIPELPGTLLAETLKFPTELGRR